MVGRVEPRLRPPSAAGRRSATLALGLGLAAANACGGDAASDLGPRCARAVCVTAVKPVEGNPLAAVVEVTTRSRTVPEVAVRAPDRTWVVPPTGFLTPLPARRHRVALVGLEAARPVEIEVRASEETADPVVYTPPPLPADLPPFDVRIARPGAMEPGYTVTPVGTGLEHGQASLVALDADGDVVWLSRAAPDVPLVLGERTARGSYLVNRNAIPHVVPGPSEIVELDFLGRPVASWSVPPPDLLHHDVVELSDGRGHLLALRSELRTIAGYPHGRGRETYAVVGDVLVELARDGSVVDELSLFDLLDPYRVPHPDFHTGSYDPVYGLRTRDWLHANEIVPDPRTGHVIVSLRHQDAVIAVDRERRALVWVLGEDDPETSGDDGWPFLRLVGDGLLPRHQHAPELTPDGHLLLYDNGNGRPGGPPASRVVEYAIDAERLEVREVWSWQDPDAEPPLYSTFVGDANRLPGGTVLVTDGGVWDHPPFGRHWARIVEVEPRTGEKVWEVEMRAPDGTPVTAVNAIRVPSLYPPEPVPTPAPSATAAR